MVNLSAILIALTVLVGFILGIWWLIWSLWSWVLPQLWPTGPEALIHPSYWLFAGAWVLFGLIVQAFFGRTTKNQA